MFNIDQVIEDALDNGIDIEWEPEYDDWVTDRKGGYEITYDIVDEDSWQKNIIDVHSIYRLIEQKHAILSRNNHLEFPECA